MSAPEDSMDDRLTLQALREEMVFTRVLLGEQYATSIDAGAATREEITAHILNCGRIAEHLSNNQTSAIADAAKAMIAALPKGYRGEVSIGVQKEPPIGVQKGPPSSSSVTGMTGAPFALVVA